MFGGKRCRPRESCNPPAYPIVRRRNRVSPPANTPQVQGENNLHVFDQIHTCPPMFPPIRNSIQPVQYLITIFGITLYCVFPSHAFLSHPLGNASFQEARVILEGLLVIFFIHSLDFFPNGLVLLSSWSESSRPKSPGDSHEKPFSIGTRWYRGNSLLVQIIREDVGHGQKNQNRNHNVQGQSGYTSFFLSRTVNVQESRVRSLQQDISFPLSVFFSCLSNGFSNLLTIISFCGMKYIKRPLCVKKIMDTRYGMLHR